MIRFSESWNYYFQPVGDAVDNPGAHGRGNRPSAPSPFRSINGPIATDAATEYYQTAPDAVSGS
jgi:hypothetical protein